MNCKHLYQILALGKKSDRLIAEAKKLPWQIKQLGSLNHSRGSFCLTKHLSRSTTIAPAQRADTSKADAIGSKFIQHD